MTVTVQNTALCKNKYNQMNLKNKTCKNLSYCQQGYFYKLGFLGGALF